MRQIKRRMTHNENIKSIVYTLN